MENKITDEVLIRLGFTEAIDFMGDKCWRIKIPYYSNIIQVTLHPECPRTNPNCGIFSIYHPAETVDTIGKNGRVKKLKLKEHTQPIAWYVDTLERLALLIKVITHENLY